MKKLIILLLVLSSVLTKAQTFELFDLDPGANLAGNPKYFTEYNGKLYFKALNINTTGNELWESDGTQSGTKLFMDIRTGTSSCSPIELNVWNNKLYFVGAYDATGGQEPWVTDGTVAGTNLVSNINQTTSSSAKEFTPMGGKLYFTANDGLRGRELWATDGTQAGTSMVKDIFNGANSSNPNSLTVYNGKLYFVAIDNVNGFELWESDGTLQGTKMVKDINTNGGGVSQSGDLVVYNNKLYFSAATNGTDFQLWQTDGTQLGTQILKTINPTGTSNPNSFVLFDNKMFFMANDGVNGFELWSTDGTNLGTIRISNINPSGSSSPQNFMVYNSRLYFAAYDGLKTKLCFSDGTAANTGVVPGLANGQNPENLTVYNGRLYYTAEHAPNDIQLFQHLSVNNTYTTGKIEPISGTKVDACFLTKQLKEYNGSLYFNANYDNASIELWKLTTTPTSVNDLSNTNDIKIYPNPSSNILQIESSDNIENIKIYDISGRLVIQQKTVSDEVDISKLSIGSYIIQIQTKRGIAIRKIQKVN